MTPSEKQDGSFLEKPHRGVVFHVELSRAVLTALGLIFLVAWIFILTWRIGPKKTISPSQSTSGEVSQQTFKCKPGPWGDLECTRITIEPPEEFIFVDVHNNTSTPPPWTLKNCSREQLTALLRSADLDAAQRKSILAHARRNPSVNGFLIAPDKDLILGMKPSQRSVIYSALSAFPENRFQYEPFRFRADVIENWFDQRDLPPEAISQVKTLLYHRGTSLLFSDVEQVLPLLASASERMKFLKILSRKSTLLMKLNVNQDSDLAGLENYWERGGRAKDLGPLLASLSKIPGGQKIDIIHFLPLFARTRLYTYPHPSDDPAATKQDCFWTSMNFFGSQPDDRYTDASYLKKTLDTDYYPISTPPLLGDLVFFTKPQGEVVHCAVYVADDILFTKNGAAYSSPWILMTLDDMVAFYPADPPLQIHIYRQKTL